MEGAERAVRDQNHGLLRWGAEILVVTLLLVAGLTYRFDLGDRLLGPDADPRTDPAAVAAPEGLALPPTQTAPRVARTSTAGRIDSGAVAAKIRPMLRRATLGKHYSVLVTDLDTGAEVFRAGAKRVTPASTAKLLTSVAVLESLGPMARFRTSVRFDPARGRLVLVGGGDPLLGSSPRAGNGSYPTRADLETLARKTVRQLRNQGVKRARLAYDDSYFTGPAVNPRWPASYIPEDVVPPIGALWVEEGRAASFGFVADPAQTAGETFADALRAAGLQVRGSVGRASGPAMGTELTYVSSAPLGEIVERTLALSDNEAAEVLLRHVGLAERQVGSFEAGSAAVLDVLGRLGVATAGDRLYDGSGLSREDLLAPETLAAVLRVAASPDHPELRVGDHRAARRRVHRLAAGPFRPRSCGRAGPGQRQDRHPHRRARPGRAGPRRLRGRDGLRRDRRPGRRTQDAGGAAADRPDRGRAGRVQVRRRVVAMSSQERPGMVDWDLAVRVGSRLVGEGPVVSRSEANEAVEELRAGADRSTPLVREFTGLVATERSAPVLVIDRQGWIQANADAFATIISPLIEKLQQRKGAPGPLAEAVGSRITGVELGAMLGFLGSKVLGQFDPFHEAPGEQGRLLLVAPNIVHTEREIGADPQDFRLWVCLHEETHRVQFTAVPWMTDHLRGEMANILGSVKTDPSEMLGELARKVVDLVTGKAEGSLLELFSGPEQRAVIERVTGVMSLLEGHADVVMDGVGPEVIPSVAAIRAKFTQRREGIGALDKLLRRLLGLDQKMAQYRDGAVFVRAVIDKVGMEGFNAVWAEPANLPSQTEIHDPSLWVSRVHG